MLFYVFALVVVLLAGVFLKIKFGSGESGPNPFDKDHYKKQERRPLEHDKAKRARVLKQGYTAKKVPDDLDAIVIGSGIGGLCAATLLAKTGKKVLVLEQHDQAGGCCHTFYEKEYEFDTGIHYIGQMKNNTTMKLLLDVLTGDQLEWAHLPEVYDRVVLGDPETDEKIRWYDIVGSATDVNAFRDKLYEYFPNDKEAIDKYLKAISTANRETMKFIATKLVPKNIVDFLISSGVVHWLTSFFTYSRKTLKEVLDSITDNDELKSVLGYCWGDYGTPPAKGSFVAHSILVNHFLKGASYPVGGSSEFAFHMIPIIEQAGGKVLVRGKVSEIIVEDGKACGVIVERDGAEIRAPVVISDAGIFNTFSKLLPKEVSASLGMNEMVKKVEHGISMVSVFIGIKGDQTELKLPKGNTWAFRKPDHDALIAGYVASKGHGEIPLVFASFPCTKDPTWQERFPGKSTCEVITMAPFEWFEKWQNERVMKRGDEYEEFKANIGRSAWNYILKLYPHLADVEIEYLGVGSPLTNQHYLNSPKGEVYGVDHTPARYEQTFIRPSTPLPSLYLTGQDTFNCGFGGALFGGVLSASAVLNRNVYMDLVNLYKENKAANANK